MDLSKLSAQELARIDAVCLDFEEALRKGRPVSIDDYLARHGGPHSELLRAELEGIREEISETEKINPPFGFSNENDTPESIVSATSKPTPPFGSSATNSTPQESKHEFVTIDQDTPTSDESSPRHGKSPGAKEPLPREGSMIGPYRLLAPLGKGGMGIVFRASDSRLDRAVAIKMLHASGSRKQELIDRFEREARAVAALSHPNIVELYDVGVTGNTPFAVMEFLDGPTLARHLDHNELSTTQIRTLGSQIASALEAAHSGGVIHRDLKPQNIVMVRAEQDEQRVKLLDFGLSREFRTDSDLRSRDVEKTREGTILGTPGYMAPEQARGEPATSAADIFGLGCILYEAFYRESAIKGETVADRFAATLSGTPEPQHERRCEDPELVDLIQSCLEFEPTNRPTAREINEVLRVPSDVSDGCSKDLSHRRSFFVALGGGVVGVLGAAYLYSPGDQPSGGGMLRSIGSLGVLSFDDYVVSGRDKSEIHRKPIGGRELFPGEMIAVALVNELSRIDQLRVRPFVPLHAETDEDFIRIGKELEVEALVTGKLRPVKSEGQDRMEVTIRVISARDATELWTQSVIRSADDQIFHHSELAGDIANQIGMQLVPTASELEPPVAAQYNCYVDGKARATGDSISGMQKAILCFEHAHSTDRKSVEPLASLAITSLALAAQSSAQDAKRHVQRAIDSIKKAREIDDQADLVRLADGMYKWQTLRLFSAAKNILSELAERNPYQYEYLHQYGLLLTAMGQDELAREHLSSAALMHSMSPLLKTDAARLEWYAGDPDAAILDAKSVLKNYPGNALAIGLLTDIYEQQGQYGDAASVLGLSSDDDSPEVYFRKRQERLGESPYGPFGDQLNSLVYSIRTGNPPDAQRVSELSSAPLPMFSLILARHPALSETRTILSVKRYLPPATT